MTTVYISIGNSDDKLTQAEWAQFWTSTDAAICENVKTMHGRWMSEPTSRFQNACWCVEIAEGAAINYEGRLRHRLKYLAAFYRQDSIAWAPAVTEFLEADRG